MLIKPYSILIHYHQSGKPMKQKHSEDNAQCNNTVPLKPLVCVCMKKKNRVQPACSMKLKESSSPQTSSIDHWGPKAIIMI